MSAENKRPESSLDRAANAFSTYKQWVGTITFIVSGAVALVAPLDKLPEDVSPEIVRGVGGILLFLGICFLLSLVGPESIAFRARSGALLVVAIALPCLFIWAFGPAFQDAWILQSEGVSTRGRIEDKRWRLGAKTTPWHTVVYEGRRKKIRLAEQHSDGESIALLFHPQRPDIVSPGVESDHFVTLVRNRLGYAWGIAGVVITVFCALSSLYLLRNFLLGPPKKNEAA